MIIRSKQNGAPGIDATRHSGHHRSLFYSGRIAHPQYGFLPFFTDIIQMIWLIQLQARLH